MGWFGGDGGRRAAPLRAQLWFPTGAGLVPERAAPGAGEAGGLADADARGPVRHPHPQLRPQRQLPPQAGRQGRGVLIWGGSAEPGEVGGCWGFTGSYPWGAAGLFAKTPGVGHGCQSHQEGSCFATSSPEQAAHGEGDTWGQAGRPSPKVSPLVSPGAGRAAGQVLVRGPQDGGEAAGLPGAEGGLGLSPAGGQHVSLTAAAPLRAAAGTPAGAA